MREQPSDRPNPERGGFALTQSDIDEFKQIIRQEFGVELTDPDAWSRVIELIHLYRSLLGPIPEDPERFSPVRTSGLIPAQKVDHSTALE